MAEMLLTWTLRDAGWADVAVTDHQTQADAAASYVSEAPEDLLTAVARLVLGEAETRVQFEAEPTAFRWILRRDGHDVAIRLLELADGRAPDNAGTEIWSSRQSVDTLARTVLRCFDQVAHQHGEDEYRRRWRRPFPRSELEALRTAWRTSQSSRDDEQVSS